MEGAWKDKDLPERSERSLTPNIDELRVTEITEMKLANTNFKPIQCGTRTPEAMEPRSLTPPLPSRRHTYTPPLETQRGFRNESPSITVENSTNKPDPYSLDFNKITELIHPKFVRELLPNLEVFLKSTNTKMGFPNLSQLKEAFLVKLVVDKRNLFHNIFDNASKDICKEIVKTLHLNKDIFKWEHELISSRNDRRELFYKKVYLRQNINSTVFKVPQALALEKSFKAISQSSKSKIGCDDTEMDKSLEKSKPKSMGSLDLVVIPDHPTKHLTTGQKNFKKMCNALTLPFIMTTMQDIVDLILDETRKELVLTDLTTDQTKFVLKIQTHSARGRLELLSNAECVPLVKQLVELLNVSPKPLVTNVGPARKKCNLRTVRIVKYNSNDNKVAQRPTNANISWQSATDDLYKGDVFMKALSLSTDSGDSVDIPDKPDSSRSVDSEMKSTVSSGSHELAANKQRPVRPRATPRLQSLAHALTVPVDSDKAVRMMKLMGWEGGALGLRGDGITEPIMPAIDLVSGAGLGAHTAVQQKRAPKVKESVRSGILERDLLIDGIFKTVSGTEFRKDLLENILDLLEKEDKQEIILVVGKKLKKKQRRFTLGLIRSINGRLNMRLNDEYEKEYISRIMQFMSANGNVALVCEMLVGDRQLLITKKTTDQVAKPKKRRKKNPSKTNVSITEQIYQEQPQSELFDSQVTSSDISAAAAKMAEIKQNISKSNLEYIAYRLVLIEKLLEFARSRDQCHVVLIEVELLPKHCRFLDSVVSNVNNRTRSGYSSKEEKKLIEELVTYADDNFFFVNFEDSFTKLRLTRHECSRRTMSQLDQEMGSIELDDQVDGTKSSNEENYYNKFNRRKSKNDTSSDSDDSINFLEPDSELDRKAKDINGVVKEGNSIKVLDENMNRNRQKIVDEDIEMVIEDLVDYDGDIVGINDGILDSPDRQSDLMLTDEVITKEMGEILLLDDDNDPKDASPASSKRSRTESNGSDVIIAKKQKVLTNKYNIRVVIVPNGYPENLLGKETAVNIQKTLFNKISDGEGMFHLKCTGFQDGRLAYRCFNVKSFNWLQNVIEQEFLDLQIVELDVDNQEKTYKVCLKVNSLDPNCLKELLDRLKLFNSNVDTEKWCVLKHKNCDVYQLMFVIMDAVSYKFVEDCNFRLHAGFDVVEFSNVWD